MLVKDESYKGSPGKGENLNILSPLTKRNNSGKKSKDVAKNKHSGFKVKRVDIDQCDLDMANFEAGNETPKSSLDSPEEIGQKLGFKRSGTFFEDRKVSRRVSVLGDAAGVMESERTEKKQMKDRHQFLKLLKNTVVEPQDLDLDDFESSPVRTKSQYAQ
jgi:hypothetical protein